MHRPRASSHEKRRKPCFFKFFFPGVTDKQLEVPKAFLKHMDGEYCDTVSLKGPSRKIWHVNLTEESSGVVLQSGWQQFVKDHSVQVGYCLVFKYYGKLRFTVKIFDTSGCEKIHFKEENIVAKQGNEPLNTSSLCCDGHVVYQDPTDGDLVAQSLFKRSKEPGEQNLVIALPKTEANQSSEVGDKRRRPSGRSSCHFYISQRRPVTKEEIGRAYEAAKSFTSRHPTASVVMRKSYVYYGFCLSLPNAFTRSSMPKASLSLITLCDPSGKEWAAKYAYHKNHRKGVINAPGWVPLSVANNIEEDDVCVFELIGRKKMQLHIFRVVDEIRPLLRPSR